MVHGGVPSGVPGGVPGGVLGQHVRGDSGCSTSMTSDLPAYPTNQREVDIFHSQKSQEISEKRRNNGKF